MSKRRVKKLLRENEQLQAQIKVLGQALIHQALCSDQLFKITLMEYIAEVKQVRE